MEQHIIFTDLDGTMLDYANYSFERALPALALLRQKEIPLVICSSKTRSEIEYYRNKLANNHPFISENGGGIFIPKNYFKTPLSSTSYSVDEEDAYSVIRLGARYTDLRDAIKELKEECFEITGFGDMTAQELADMANMTIDEAVMAKERDFDEPFIYSCNRTQELINAITAKGFNVTQGRFFHILGNSNKGIAVAILADLYRAKHGEIITIAVGDSPNDLPMLQQVNIPILVQKPDGKYDSEMDMQNLIRADGIGPEGWNKALLRLFSVHSTTLIQSSASDD